MMVFRADFDSLILAVNSYENEKENDDDGKEEESHLNQMIDSQGASEGVKLWGDVLAKSVIHVKPGHYSHHHFNNCRPHHERATQRKIIFHKCDHL